MRHRSHSLQSLPERRPAPRSSTSYALHFQTIKNVAWSPRMKFTDSNEFCSQPFSIFSTYSKNRANFYSKFDFLLLDLRFAGILRSRQSFDHDREFVLFASQAQEVPEWGFDRKSWHHYLHCTTDHSPHRVSRFEWRGCSHIPFDRLPDREHYHKCCREGCTRYVPHIWSYPCRMS